MLGLVSLSRSELDPNLLVHALSLYLLALLLLVILLFLSTFVLVRTMRRVRQNIWRRPAPPTAFEDVWAMHRLPGEFDDRQC